jgi:hypothetical protein
MRSRPSKRSAIRVPLKRALIIAGAERVFPRRTVRAVLILLGLEHA